MANLDQIDREITQWQANLASARDNLFALYEHPTFKRLDANTPPVSGTTAALVSPALAAMNELFAQMDQLTGVVEKAAKIRRGATLFPWSAKAENEILALLDGPSIALPPISTPLEQRGLLTAAEQARAITPTRLLEAMTKAFSAAKSAVLQIDDAWAKIDPVIGVFATKLDTLDAMAKTLGDEAKTQVDAVHEQLDALRELSRCDPLSATQGLAPMHDALDRIRTAFSNLAQQRTSLDTRVNAANALIASIRDARPRADDAAAKCLQCIDNPSGLLASVTDTQLDELTDWLTTLKECQQQGHLNALAKGLERWEQTASQYSALQTAALNANEGKLELLAELKGRFSALKVKAVKRGVSPTLAQIEHQASECLSRPLIPLEQATQLVTNYENLLNAAG